MKVSDKMYNKRPTDVPSPPRDWATSGSRKNGDAEIRMLNEHEKEPCPLCETDLIRRY